MGRRRAIGVLALLLLAGACSSDDAGGAPEAGRTTATTTAPDDAGPPTTDGAIRIVLGTGRVTVGGNALVFDAPASQVTSYLERALDEPHDESDQDCGPGRLRVLAWEGLQVFLLEGRLVGWSVDDETYATDQGIALGSSRDELRTAYPTVAFPDSSLGDEFFVAPTGPEAAGLSGLLLGDRVSALWSGATCVAR